MPDPTKDLEQARCPRCARCKKDLVRRSHRRGMAEVLASGLGLYPYRCEDCDYRFLAFRVGLLFMSWKTPLLAITRPSDSPARERTQFYWVFAVTALFVVLGVVGWVWVTQYPDQVRELSKEITKAFAVSIKKKPPPADK